MSHVVRGNGIGVLHESIPFVDAGLTLHLKLTSAALLSTSKLDTST